MVLFLQNMRTGNQTPRLCIEPRRVTTDGGDAALLMQEYGVTLLPWQRTVLDCWLGKDADGNYVVSSAGLSEPRQNGKNVCLEGREFYGMVVNRERILHTAHQTKTSKKSFRRLEAMFTDRRHPEVCKLVKDIRYTNGEEAIELHNGARIEFATRTRQAARGFDGISLVVYDEAQELTDDQVDAIAPTLAASTTGTRQIIYTGTPPYPGCPGVVFRRRRDACVNDPVATDAWHEWGVFAESVTEIDVDDVGLWYDCNPSLGYFLSEAYTAEERRSMAPDGFARERLGWWPPAAAAIDDRCIDEAVWDACRSEELKPEGKTAYGVKFSADGAEVALCGAVVPKSGPARISLIERRPTGMGTQWLADWLNARSGKASCVVIDGRNGVDVLVEKISGTWRFKNSVIRPTSKDVLAAVSLLCNDLAEQNLSWYAGQEALRDSAITSVKRPISGGWGFGGDNSSPIEAASLALWGAKTSKRDPTREMLIG